MSVGASWAAQCAVEATLGDHIVDGSGKVAGSTRSPAPNLDASVWYVYVLVSDP